MILMKLWINECLIVSAACSNGWKWKYLRKALINVIILKGCIILFYFTMQLIILFI